MAQSACIKETGHIFLGQMPILDLKVGIGLEELIADSRLR